MQLMFLIFFFNDSCKIAAAANPYRCDKGVLCSKWADTQAWVGEFEPPLGNLDGSGVARRAAARI